MDKTSIELSREQIQLFRKNRLQSNNKFPNNNSKNMNETDSTDHLLLTPQDRIDMFAGSGTEPILIVKQKKESQSNKKNPGYEDLFEQGLLASPKNQFTLAKCVNPERMYPTNLQIFKKNRNSVNGSTQKTSKIRFTDHLNSSPNKFSQTSMGFRVSDYSEQKIPHNEQIPTFKNPSFQQQQSPSQLSYNFLKGQIRTASAETGSLQNTFQIPMINQYYHERGQSNVDRSGYYLNKMQQSPVLDRNFKKHFYNSGQPLISSGKIENLSKSRQPKLQNISNEINNLNTNKTILNSEYILKDNVDQDCDINLKYMSAGHSPKQISSQLKQTPFRNVSQLRHSQNIENSDQHYEYGPQMQQLRYQYQPMIIKPSNRSKVKLYTQNDYSSGQTEIDTLRDSRFFSQRGKSSQVNNRVIINQFAQREEIKQRQFRLTTPITQTNIIDSTIQNHQRSNEKQISFDKFKKQNEASLLLKSKEKYKKKQDAKKREKMDLINQVDKLLTKKDSFAEMLDKFRQVDKIEKLKEADADFINLIAKSKVIPTRFDSTFTEKIFLYQKLEDMNPNKMLLKKDLDNQITDTVKNQYYKQITDCHQFIKDALDAKTKQYQQQSNMIVKQVNENKQISPKKQKTQ
eukprot:403351381